MNEKLKRTSLAISGAVALAVFWDLVTRGAPAAEPPKDEPATISGVASAVTISLKPTETPTPFPSLTPKPEPSSTATLTKTRLPVGGGDPKAGLTEAARALQKATEKALATVVVPTATKVETSGEITLAPGQQREFRVPNISGGLQFGVVARNYSVFSAEYFAPEQVTLNGQIMEGQKHNGMLSRNKNTGLKDNQGNIILPFDLSTGAIGNVNNTAKEQQGRPWVVIVKNNGGQPEPFRFFTVDVAKGCEAFSRYEPPVSVNWQVCKDQSNKNEWAPRSQNQRPDKQNWNQLKKDRSTLIAVKARRQSVLT